MRTTVKVAPAAEPLTLALTKTQLRIDHSDEDTNINLLIAAARAYFERETGFSLIQRTLEAHLRFWPKSTNILLPYPPLVSVTSISYKVAGTPTTLPSNLYTVDKDSRQGSIVLVPGQTWPTTLLAAPGVTVEYVAGFGAAEAAVPSDIRECLLQVIAHWYENPEAVYAPGDSKSAGNVQVMPLSAKSTIDYYRSLRER